MKFEFVNFLTEAITGRTPHPEDSIFAGSVAAADAIKSLGSVIANPANVTIKWDGFPALIFGRTPEGRIAIMDKYMFDKRVLATSPQDWINYDASKANPSNRADLYKKLEFFYAGLDKVVTGSGFYWGDLLWAGQLQPVNGMYVFKPNTVEYAVPIQSDIGKLIQNSIGGIVVHQQFSELGGEPSAWNGNGLQNVKGGIAIITPGMGIKFKLKEPVQQSKAASSALNKFGGVVDDLLAVMPGSTKQSIQTYFNKKITGQTTQELHDWMKTNVSAKQYNQLVGDDYSGIMFVKDASGEVSESPGYTGLKAIFNAIYAYKMALVQQLESQVSGVQQSVNGQPGGEGFVFPTPTGLVKLVNRGQFSAANFNK